MFTIKYYEDKSKIKMNSIVTIQNIVTGEIKEFKLVPVEFSLSPTWIIGEPIPGKDYSKKTIKTQADGIMNVSIDSKLGEQCLGKKIYDFIEYTAPNGESMKFLILNFRN